MRLSNDWQGSLNVLGGPHGHIHAALVFRMHEAPPSSAFRRERISPVGIPLANASIAAVDQELAPLVPGDRTARRDRFILCGVDGRGTAATGGPDGPSTVMRDDVLIAR